MTSAMETVRSVKKLQRMAARDEAHGRARPRPGPLADVHAGAGLLETVRSVKKLHRIAARDEALVVLGHDPDLWPTFTQAPGFYD